MSAKRRYVDTQSDTVMQHNFNNFVKAMAVKQAATQPDASKGLSVLDLGCGKGGDLLKWGSNNTNVTYVGVDCDQTLLDAAQQRHDQFRSTRKNYGIRRVSFVCQAYKDFGSEEFIKSLLTRNGGRAFDVVSCMYSLHFAFETKATLDSFFTCVKRCLRKDGVFVAITTDTRVIMKRLWESPCLAFGNALYSVTTDSANTWTSAYGNRVRFRMKDAQGMLEYEYVPSEREIMGRLRTELGAQTIQSANTLVYGLDAANNPQNNELVKIMCPLVQRDSPRTITRDEWEIAGLYRLYAAIKAI